ncbi:TPA: hypothetical protein ACH3X3_003850 [Trebouxia sp. C0006]
MAERTAAEIAVETAVETAAEVACGDCCREFAWADYDTAEGTAAETDETLHMDTHPRYSSP